MTADQGLVLPLGGWAASLPKPTTSACCRLIEAFVAGPQPAASDRAALPMLTDREREVLALVGSGKTGARDRAQLVVLAYESRLIKLGGPVR